LISSEALRLYYGLLDRFVDMQRQFYGLNASYYSLLDNFTTLLSNQSQLQERFDGLNNSFYDHLLDYDTQMQNMRNLMYILAAATAIFLIATVYLSRIAHSRAKTRIKVIRER
jgi:Mg2+ and Co2+ transporter CorA